MASPPLTSREYAYMRIVGDSGDHSTITTELGIDPTNAWNKGDPNPKNGRVRNFTSWQLESGLNDMHAIEEHLVELFRIFEPLSEKLLTLSQRFDIYIQCVGYFPASGHGIHIEKSHVKMAAAMGAAFDLDFYYVDDHEHDLDYV